MNYVLASAIYSKRALSDHRRSPPPETDAPAIAALVIHPVMHLHDLPSASGKSSAKKTAATIICGSDFSYHTYFIPSFIRVQLAFSHRCLCLQSLHRAFFLHPRSKVDKYTQNRSAPGLSRDFRHNRKLYFLCNKPGSECHLRNMRYCFLAYKFRKLSNLFFNSSTTSPTIVAEAAISSVLAARLLIRPLT